MNTTKIARLAGGKPMRNTSAGKPLTLRRAKCATWLALAAAFWFACASIMPARAGNLDSPGASTDTASNMYSLLDIYNRLATGTVGTPSAFSEPGAGPTTGTGRTLNEVMAKAPAANANAAATSEVVSGKTFWGLSAGAWGLTTGTRALAPVPKTGQTTSYAAGDDGALQKGVASPSPRFTDNGNGTVTDNLTKLVWLKVANYNSTAGGTGTATWANALTFCNALHGGQCGLTDGSTAGVWRLPNLRELQSLIDYSRAIPALPSGHPFAGVQSSFYWSSTALAGSMNDAWGVGLYDGFVDFDAKTSPYYVWPVRGGQ